jgi:arginine-tRNA-protein transferase
MKILQENKISDEEVCPYLNSEKITQEYFFATDMNASEYQELLESSWRRFGIFFFKYACKTCNKCKPIRIDLENFTLSKSQKKVLKKNAETKVIIRGLSPSLEIYNIYEKHSINKFNKKTNLKEFLEAYYYNFEYALQSEYYINDKLVAIGFIDQVNNAFSSIYFAYDTDYSEFSLGTFSILYEANHAKSLNLKYYYIGYYIKENKSMKYKNNFKENQILNQETMTWIKNNE